MQISPSLPLLPKPRFVERGAYAIAYFVVGPENGRPLLLCHGLGANGLQFVADAQYFAAQGFRVIVPDLRGHGRSTCPAARSDDDFSIETLAADLVAILDAENIETINWVGNSLGGILALSLMASAPERLVRVITFGTSYSLNVPRIAIPLMRGAYKIFGTRFLAWVGAPSTSKFKPARDVIFAMLCDIDTDVVTRTTSHLAHYDLIKNAIGFEKPILMIRGSGDRQVNAALGSTLEGMAHRENFEIIELADAGHCANLDQPDKLREIVLDFLRETP